MRDEILETLGRDLEAARYRAQRAERQYEAIDPQNRLVAQELERRWNQAMEDVRKLEGRIADESEAQTGGDAGKAEFQALATDLESVWNDSHSDERTKKRILRTLIRELIVDIDEQTSEVVVLIHWKGGAHTPLRLPRRRRGHSDAHTSKDIIDAVRMLCAHLLR